MAAAMGTGEGVAATEGTGICVASGGGLSPQATIKAGRSMRKSKTPLARLTTAKMVAREWPVCFCIPLYMVSRQQRQRLSNLSFEKVISPRSTGIRLINSGQLPTCMILFSLRLEQVRFYHSIILL